MLARAGARDLCLLGEYCVKCLGNLVCSIDRLRLRLGLVAAALGAIWCAAPSVPKAIDDLHLADTGRRRTVLSGGK